MELLRSGYAQDLLLDASADTSMYGRKVTDLAAQMVDSTAGPFRGHVLVCPIAEDSTRVETKYVGHCLEQLGARSALLVTSDFHTRRAYSIFRHQLPQYLWSVAAAHDNSVFGQQWWLHREWAKTAWEEFQRLVWWHLGDRWR